MATLLSTHSHAAEYPRFAAQICRRLLDIIDNTPLIQYIIERSAAGYTPEVPHGVGVVPALETFRRTQRVYRHPQIQTSAVCRLGHEALHKDEWRLDFGLDSIGDMVLLKHTTRTAIGVLSLRSDVPVGQRLRRLQFDCEIVTGHYFVSVSQDLIMFASNNCLRFRSFTTGRIPKRILAVRGNDTPISEDNFPSGNLIWKNISIHGDWMLVIINVPGEFITVRKLFHWPSGRAVRVEFIAHSRRAAYSQIPDVNAGVEVERQLGWMPGWWFRIDSH